MKQEKVIEKVRKILELSRNNPSKEEAQSAALMAQELMAKYHISMKEVEAKEEEPIMEKRTVVGNGNKWKYTLANVIARNFRCKTFSYGSDTIVFYGFDTDAEIAQMTFETLFEIGQKGANNLYMRERNKALKAGCCFNGRGLKNAFLIGFIEGIRSELDKQSVALMVIVPEEVTEKYKERSNGFKTVKNTLRYRKNESVREEGRQLGRNSMRRNRLEQAYA